MKDNTIPLELNTGQGTNRFKVQFESNLCAEKQEFYANANIV